MTTCTFLAISALFWLLVLSTLCWYLTYGTEAEKAKSEKGILVPVMLILAWTTTVGVVLWEWIKKSLFD